MVLKSGHRQIGSCGGDECTNGGFQVLQVDWFREVAIEAGQFALRDILFHAEAGECLKRPRPPWGGDGRRHRVTTSPSWI